MIRKILPLFFLSSCLPTIPYTNPLSSIICKKEEKNPNSLSRLCIYYLLNPSPTSPWILHGPTDIRVETSGQWTRGMMTFDKRDRYMEDEEEPTVLVDPPQDPPKEMPGDAGLWLSKKFGNRVYRLTEGPGGERFATELLERIFGI